eukprot:s4392_g1.t1
MSLNHVFQSLKRGHQEFRLQPMWKRQRRLLLHSSSSALGNLKFLLFFCAFLAELRISCASQVANVFFEDADTKPTVRLNHSEHFREEPQGDAQVRRLSSGLASVTSISFTDTDSAAFEVGGTVSWVAPADLTNIVQYHVRLNWDLSDTVVKTQLFHAALPLPCLCVLDPTTSWLFGAVEKRSDDGPDLATYPADQYPAQWLFVLTAGASPSGEMAAGDPIQTVSEAAHMRLIDLQSTELPTSIQLETLTFTDQTDPGKSGTHVQGILDWTTTGPDYPQVYEDWALADEFEVYLAESSSLTGTLSTSLGTVTIGTASGVTTWQLTIPETLLSGANALVVKAKNSVGQAPLSGAQSEVYLLPTTTSTSVTSTTTVLYSLAGTQVTFSDSDPNAGVIAGSIGWQTPLSTSEITAYAIYMSYDSAGSQKQLITDAVVPPATSHSISGLTRETGDPTFPANWIIVYPMVQGTLAPVSVAAYVELYDDSGTVPPAPAFSSVDFTDEDAQGGYASGTVRWVLDGNTLHAAKQTRNNCTNRLDIAVRSLQVQQVGTRRQH